MVEVIGQITLATVFDGEKGDTGLQGLQGDTGNQGIQGATGANGLTSYTHIAYANNATGTSGFSVSDSVGKLYIGMYTDFTAIDSTDATKYKWTLIKGSDGSQGIQGTKGTDGQTPYLHIAYATNSTGTAGFSVTDSVAKTYIGTYTDFTSADSTNPALYSWSLIKGDKGDKGDTGNTGLQGLQGTTGSQGIQGATGANGLTSYTHIAYATNATGTAGFSVGDSVGKTYIGMYTDFTQTDSTNPSLYKWTLIKGADGTQGIQGTAGANGQTPYLHIAYSTSATGSTGFSTTDAVGKTYIGTYTDFVSADSSTASLYTWSLIKGDKGDTGSQGIQGLQGIQGTTGSQGIQGNAGVNGTSSYTHIAYSTSPTGATGFSTSNGAGATYIGMYVDSIVADSNTPSMYTWTLIKGADGSQGIQGTAGANGQTPYLHIAYANSSNGVTGFSTTDSVNKLFIGTYTDFVSADSTNPALYSWTLIKGDIGATGSTGAKGDAGELNLVNNPHNSGNVTGWAGAVYGTSAFIDGRTIGVGDLTSTGSLMSTHTVFNIEPQKMYEFSVWLKQSVTKGTNYFGIYAYNSAMTNIGAYAISNVTGVKVATLNTNGYFWSGTKTAGVWEKHTGYIIPAGFDTSDVEYFKGLGENVTSIFQFPSDANKATMRVLNYTNTVSTTLSMGLPMVKEVDISVLEANRVKNLNKLVEGKINNAVTTIDGSGVTVKDGNFLLADSNSTTKYSVDAKRNLVKDHGFELIQHNDTFGTYGSLMTAKNPQANSLIGWQTKGYPLVRGNFDIDGNYQWIMFGNQSVVVDYGSHFYQDIPVVALVNYAYAISFYATAPKESSMTAGTPQLVVEWWTGGALSTTQTVNFPVPNRTLGQKQRYASTFLVPNALTYNTNSFMRVYVRTVTTSTWVEIDGFQVVESSIPTSYNDESSLWELTAGEQIAETMRVRNFEADTVSAMTFLYAQDADIMGHLNLYSQTDASATSKTHALTIGSDTSGQALKMDANEISGFSSGSPSEIHVNPDGGRTVFNNNASGGNVVIENGGIALTNAKQANTYNLATIRDGTSVHNNHMMILNVVVGVPTNNTAQAYADFTFPRAFSATPIWVISAPQDVSSTVYKSAVYTPTATGFRIYLNHIHNSLFNGTIEVQVIACGIRT